jgi:hypothetical protein
MLSAGELVVIYFLFETASDIFIKFINKLNRKCLCSYVLPQIILLYHFQQTIPVANSCIHRGVNFIIKPQLHHTQERTVQAYLSKTWPSAYLILERSKSATNVNLTTNTASRIYYIVQLDLHCKTTEYKDGDIAQKTKRSAMGQYDIPFVLCCDDLLWKLSCERR